MHVYQHAKNQLNPPIHSRDKQILEWTKIPSCPFLAAPTQKLLKSLLAFLNLLQYAKNPFTPSIHNWDTANFWSYPFLTMPNLKCFNQHEFVSTWKKTKKQLISSFLFYRYSWIKSCYQIRQEKFCRYLRTQILPKYGTCLGI